MVAAEELGGGHNAFAGGLEGEDLEGAGAGGDEEALAGVEDCAGGGFGGWRGIDDLGAVEDQAEGVWGG